MKYPEPLSQLLHIFPQHQQLMFVPYCEFKPHGVNDIVKFTLNNVCANGCYICAHNL
jgi:hypothetical protein